MGMGQNCLKPRPYRLIRAKWQVNQWFDCSKAENRGLVPCGFKDTAGREPMEEITMWRNTVGLIVMLPSASSCAARR